MAKGNSGSDEEATCLSCGRRMSPRRSDRGVQEGAERKYCSAACRRRRVTPMDKRLEERILGLLAQRSFGATICPSEAAKDAAGDDEKEWRPLMEPARRAARRLCARGEVEITQGGRTVDPSTAKGPLRIRRTSP